MAGKFLRRGQISFDLPTESRHMIKSPKHRWTIIVETCFSFLPKMEKKTGQAKAATQEQRTTQNKQFSLTSKN